VRTSGKGTALSAIYDVIKTKDNKVIDVCGTLLLIPKKKSLSVRKNQQKSPNPKMLILTNGKKHRLQCIVVYNENIFHENFKNSKILVVNDL